MGWFPKGHHAMYELYLRYIMVQPCLLLIVCMWCLYVCKFFVDVNVIWWSKRTIMALHDVCFYECIGGRRFFFIHYIYIYIRLYRCIGGRRYSYKIIRLYQWWSCLCDWFESHCFNGLIAIGIISFKCWSVCSYSCLQES